MSEMLTLTVIVATVSLHAGNVAGLVFGLSLPVNPIIIAVAVIIIAALITVGSVLYLRGGKKKAATSGGASGTMDWQRQAQQGAPGAMNAWNQQGMPADNAWGQAGQQQANAWGTQVPTQQPSGWDAQQQQANACGSRSSPA